MRPEDTTLRHTAGYAAPPRRGVVDGDPLKTVGEEVFDPGHRFNWQLQVGDGGEDDLVRQLIERLSEVDRENANCS